MDVKEPRLPISSTSEKGESSANAAADIGVSECAQARRGMLWNCLPMSNRVVERVRFGAEAEAR